MAAQPGCASPRDTPSIWHHCPHYLHYRSLAIFGARFTSPDGCIQHLLPPWSRFDPESAYGCSDAFSRYFASFCSSGSPVLTRFAPLKDGHQTTHNTFLFHFSIVPPINSREIDRSFWHRTRLEPPYVYDRGVFAPQSFFGPPYSLLTGECLLLRSSVILDLGLRHSRF